MFSGPVKQYYNNYKCNFPTQYWKDLMMYLSIAVLQFQIHIILMLPMVQY